MILERLLLLALTPVTLAWTVIAFRDARHYGWEGYVFSYAFFLATLALLVAVFELR